MRILHLATYFPRPGNPLIGTWALDQAQAFKRLPGCEVEVISLNPWFPRLPGTPRGYRAYSECPAEHRWGDLRVHYPRWLCYPMGPMFKLYHRNPELWLRLAWRFCGRDVIRRARAFAPDAIFAIHTCVNGWVAAQLARELKVPFVCQDQDYGEIADCQRYRSRRRLFEQVGTAASAMLVVSRKMEADLGRIVQPGKIGILYNGGALKIAVERLLPLSLRPQVVFGAGMLVERKGFEIVIRAWAEVVRRFPEARLRIAGDGPERTRLTALRDALGLSKSVELLGYTDHDQVLAEMANARAFILASWSEPFGVVYTEAMGAGCPVVWSTDCGIADVLTSGTHGYSVAPRDVAAVTEALIRLLGHPAEASEMGKTNRALLETSFTWDAVAAQALTILRKAVTKEPATA